MPVSQQHIVHKQRWLLKAASMDEASKLQHVLAHFSNHKLPEILNQFMNEISDPEIKLKIEKLELNLGILPNWIDMLTLENMVREQLFIFIQNLNIPSNAPPLPEQNKSQLADFQTDDWGEAMHTIREGKPVWWNLNPSKNRIQEAILFWLHNPDFYKLNEIFSQTSAQALIKRLQSNLSKRLQINFIYKSFLILLKNTENVGVIRKFIRQLLIPENRLLPDYFIKHLFFVLFDAVKMSGAGEAFLESGTLIEFIGSEMQKDPLCKKTFQIQWVKTMQKMTETEIDSLPLRVIELYQEISHDKSPGQRKFISTTNANRLAEIKEKPMDWEINNPIWISNAGLIILAPYLPRFFKEVGFLDGNNFRSEKFQEKSAWLLQKLIQPDTDFADTELILNKILCGIPSEKITSTRFIFTRKLNAECEEFLQNILANWEKLKMTSTTGFKDSFLIREGTITKDYGNYEIHVENQAYDIMLQTLPWNIRTIKLPWNNYLITTDW